MNMSIEENNLAEKSLNFIILDITHDLAYFSGNFALSHTS